MQPIPPGEGELTGGNRAAAVEFLIALLLLLFNKSSYNYVFRIF